MEIKPKIAGCSLDECGTTPDGLRVQAITDVMGAQVVVTNDSRPKDDSLLSQPLENHSAAVELGKKVAEYGISVYKEWRGPISTMFEAICVIAGGTK